MQASASSHREAPLISNDPLADNTDLYAFKSPCDAEKIVLIANYIPFEHPAGGPNWYTFGENIRYEVHVDNSTVTSGDDIVYRFTFSKVNEDTSTFFNIRLGKQNLKTTYKCERSMNGGGTFTTIVASGVVPPPNIGPRSISGAAGLAAASYNDLINGAVASATTGEKIFCGPMDDPFFVDLGGAFDLGGFRPTGRDGVAKFNCHSIVIEVPVSTLQKNGQTAASATNILDANYVIGVWASASRPQITTLSNTGGAPTTSGPWVQVSRLGMPLTNEAIIPVSQKDKWNRTNPYTGDAAYVQYFQNPELALYMDDTRFGGAVPGLSALRIQRKSLGSFNFLNDSMGLWPLKGNPALVGTAFDPATYGNILIPNNHSPRAADILPIFYTGVPNLNPYQLATGKPANSPLSNGKPFINNFLPTLCDMLRLNMAVPATPRTDPKFSSLGIVQAAVLGLTDAAYNGSTALQFIPNMDGFPNGRRLEDDVTTIELQAVSGVALAAVGLWYDDYPGTGSPVTPDLLSVVGFNAGVTKNDTSFRACFPYLQNPWAGFRGSNYEGPNSVPQIGLAAPAAIMSAYPNPFNGTVTFRYKMTMKGDIRIQVVDVTGRTVMVINESGKQPGEYTTPWNGTNMPAGNYFAQMSVNNTKLNTVKLVKID
ncbi:MAG: DUF4331 domain-containing protein [Sphingobacteriales bacterium]|nr:MAG: DUF4331 domain-containing protein [Sphingobacteriales bacterium]